jgi:photosystem II stability/assembly factor-like uncharacterized protein
MISRHVDLLILVNLHFSEIHFPLTPHLPPSLKKYHMKLMGIIVILHLFTTSAIGQAWTSIPSKLPYNKSAAFATEDVVFLVGSNVLDLPTPTGFVAKSTDGGKNFTIVWELLLADYTAVHFYNDQIGFIAGSENDQDVAVIYRTENGGQSWEPKYFNEPVPDIDGIHFLTPEIGFFWGGFVDGFLYKTIDGGDTWMEIEGLPGHALIDLHFLDHQKGFIASSDRKIFTTSDQGSTWTEVKGVPTAFLSIDALTFINEAVGFIAGTNGVVYQTIDGGQNWQPVSLPGPATPNVNQIYFINHAVGFIVVFDEDRTRLYYTSNGGTTWSDIFRVGGLVYLEWIAFSPAYTRALTGGINILYQKENANSYITPSLPYAMLSGSNSLCSGSGVIPLRLDLGGQPPWSVTLIGSQPVQYDNILASPHIIEVSPTETTNYTLGTVSDATGEMNTGFGSAHILVNPLSTAVLSGTDTVCLGEPASLSVRFTGCPPWTLTVSDGTQLFLFENINDPFYELPMPLVRDSINYVNISIHSVTDFNGVNAASISGSARIYTNQPTLDVIDQSDDDICYNELGYIRVKLTGKGPHCIQYTDGINQYETCGITQSTYDLNVTPITGTYTITGVTNACGEGIVYDNDATFEVRPIILAPENLEAELLPDRYSVQLNWDDVANNEPFYRVYRKTNEDADFELLKELSQNTETYLDNSAHEGGTTYYKVKPRDTYCESWSNVDSVQLTPSFEPIPIPGKTTSSFNIHGCVLSDLNNDDQADLIIQRTGVLLNNGSFQFEPVNPNDTTIQKLITGAYYSLADYDDDGDQDVYVYPLNFSGPRQDGIYRNEGNNSFTKINLPPLPVSGLSGEWGDIDNDMDLDLFLSGTTPSCYRNDGNDQFTLLTPPGIPANAPSIENSLVDYDNDGDLDLCLIGASIRIFNNDGTGQFNESTNHNIIASASTGSHSWQDMNHDEWLDLVGCFNTISGTGSCAIWINNGNGSFRKLNITGIFATGTVSHAVADYNNDGQNDIFVSATGVNPMFYAVNDSTFSTSLNNHLNYYENTRGGTASADINRDGYLDLVTIYHDIPNSGSFHFVYQNLKKYTGNWVEIKCVGTASNTSAIGAKIRIKSTIQGKPVWQLHHILTQTGNYAQGDLIQHFGLGEAPEIDSLVVDWPSGTKTVLTDVEINKFHIIREDGSVDLPQTPQDFVASTFSYKRIDLSWKDISDNEYGYILERSLYPDQDFVILDTLLANSTFYIDSTVGQNTVYYYRMLAYNYYGRSAYTADSARTYLTCTLYAEIEGPSSIEIQTGTYVTLQATTQPGNTYQWFFNDELLPETTEDILISRAGSYHVVVKTLENCIDTSEKVVVTLKKLLSYNPTSEIATSNGASKSIGWIDVNNDQLEDIFISNVGTSTLLINTGNGQFERQINHDLNVTGESYTAAWADYNNDGWADLFLTNRTGYSRLFRNDQNGGFTPFVIDPFARDLIIASWGDINNDGFLDLFGGTSGSGWIYINQNAQSFLRLPVGNIDDEVHDNRGATWFDYDHDDFIDLILSDNAGAGGLGNEVYRNRNNMTFNLVTSGEISKLKGSHSTNIVDFDNDGDLDIFESSDVPTHGAYMYRNLGNGEFETVTDNILVDYTYRSMGSNWADYDNDGHIDLFMGGDRTLLYRNVGQTQFDILEDEIQYTETAGQREQGVAWGDIQNDGFPDLVVARDRYTVTGPLSNLVFENSLNSNHWISVIPVGHNANYFSIGAMVHVYATIRGEATVQSRYIAAPSGGLYGGQNSLRATFGLGSTSSIDSLIVSWPCGGKRKLTGISSNQTVVVQQPGSDIMVSHFIQLCQGEAYNGQMYSDITILRDTFHLNGYDSIVITNLIPVETKVIQTYIDLGYGESYQGVLYYQDTIVLDSLVAQAGCDSLHITHINILPITPVNDPIQLIHFKLYPNPAMEEVFIEAQFDKNLENKLEVLNQLGIVMESRMLEGELLAEPISIIHYPHGLYFVRISNSLGSYIRSFTRL